MKARVNIVVVAIMIMLGTIILILARGERTTFVTAPPAPSASDTPALRLGLQAQASPTVVEQAPVPLPAAPVAAVEPAPAPAWLADTDDAAAYTSVDGDTLANVVVGLLGSDTKKNRNVVIAANPSLQADPDRVLAGKTYRLTAPDAVATTALSRPEADDAPAVPDTDRLLRYTARRGDSVSALAAGLLGEDSKTNRDAIIGRNESLKDDPDRVLTGTTYTIPTSDGLSAAPESAAAAPSELRGTEPDADAVVESGSGRDLRYTALAGDTVSKLAEVLLGSDTKVNRDAIISHNPSLKTDPDRVVAGQTYWIPAPAAPVEQP